MKFEFDIKTLLINGIIGRLNNNFKQDYSGEEMSIVSNFLNEFEEKKLENLKFMLDFYLDDRFQNQDHFIAYLTENEIYHLYQRSITSLSIENSLIKIDLKTLKDTVVLNYSVSQSVNISDTPNLNYILASYNLFKENGLLILYDKYSRGSSSKQTRFMKVKEE